MIWGCPYFLRNPHVMIKSRKKVLDDAVTTKDCDYCILKRCGHVYIVYESLSNDYLFGDRDLNQRRAVFQTAPQRCKF